MRPEDDGALLGVLLVPEAHGAGLEFVESPGGDGLGEDEVTEGARVDAVERPRAAGDLLDVEALIGPGGTPGGIGTARGDVEEVAAECAVGGSGVGGAAQGAQDAEPGAGEDGEGEVTDAREEGAVGPEDGASVAEVVGEGVDAGGEGRCQAPSKRSWRGLDCGRGRRRRASTVPTRWG
ncbi:hypothetical protein DEGR_38920 (plasmid) [Deinococcus grandis]|nr:hypothetical protein DEGR_38920 [Deinococcus grandis]